MKFQKGINQKKLKKKNIYENWGIFFKKKQNRSVESFLRVILYKNSGNCDCVWNFIFIKQIF